MELNEKLSELNDLDEIKKIGDVNAGMIKQDFSGQCAVITSHRFHSSLALVTTENKYSV